jgi:hypothetical protein
MALIKRKTKKKITKQLKKLVKKHGPEIATGLVSTIVAGLTAANLPESDGSEKSKKRKKAAAKSKSSRKAASERTEAKTSEQ